MKDVLEEMIQSISRQREERMTQNNALEQGMQTYQSSRDGNEVCKYCGGTGWEMVLKVIDGKEYEYAEKCRCRLIQNHIVNCRIKFLDLPNAFKYHKMSSFKTNIYQTEQGRKAATAVCHAVKYWLEHLEDMQERGKGLYFYSDVKGSGKTMMAAALANELMQKYNKQVKFATSVQITNEIKASWNDPDKDESKLMEAISTAEILVLDDFGIEQEGKEKDWINHRFYHIINQRYIEHKITIYTSNMSIDDLRYDERITNRIKEITFQVMFPEESVREQIAKQNQRELFEGMKGAS